MSVDFADTARAQKARMIKRRRDLHRYPELAFQEVRTASIVAQALRELGLEVQSGVGKTGVIGLLEGAQDGPTVLVRADMDALPIQEANQTGYVSLNPGAMHACGHDAHTTIGLAVAEMLYAARDQIRGRVKFVFQPAEEIGEGARAMIAEGALTNPRPDFSIGLHVWNNLPIGTVSVTPGPSMAAADILNISVRGSAGHGAQPDQTNDAVVAAAQMINALQTIASRNVAPLESAVITIGTIHGGEAFNIITDHVEMTGTIRTFTAATRELVHRRVQEICSGTAAALGCEAAVTLREMTRTVNNDANLSERIAQIAADLLGPEHVRRDVRTMGSEDMSYFMDDIPGCYFFVGSANAAQGLNYPHHNPRFDIDEEVLVIGATLLANSAFSLLGMPT